MLVIALSLLVACAPQSATPCSLLTTSEIEATLGLVTAPGVPSQGADFRACSWDGPSGGAGPIGDMYLVVRDGDVVARYEEEAQGTAVPVQGLGTRALWHRVGWVVATDGIHTVRVQWYGYFEDQQPLGRQGIERLAALALAWLAAN